jgi:heat shock protein HtpX
LSRGLGRQVRAYPGNLTYLDLIRRNKRESVLIMAAVILMGVILGAAIAATVAASSQEGGGPEDLVPSALLGAAAALIAGAVAASWSWFSGAKAILSLAGAVPTDETQDPELFHVVEEVAIAAGLPMPRLYVIPDTALNAFATGRDPAHAAVAITTGLRGSLTRDELQGVMAHELSHVRHYDIRFAMLMATLVGMIVFACDATRRSLFRGAGRAGRSRGKGGAAGAMMVILLLVLSIVAPLIARLMQLAYSRRREYLADAGAVELTRNPDGLIAALTKLAGDTDPLVDRANRASVHRQPAAPGLHPLLPSTHPGADRTAHGADAIGRSSRPARQRTIGSCP